MTGESSLKTLLLAWNYLERKNCFQHTHTMNIREIKTKTTDDDLVSRGKNKSTCFWEHRQYGKWNYMVRSQLVT